MREIPPLLSRKKDYAQQLKGWAPPNSPLEGSQRSKKSLADLEDKGEVSSLQLLDSTNHPLSLPKKLFTLLSLIPSIFLGKINHFLKIEDWIPQDLLEESWTRVLVPSLSMKLAQHSFPSLHFKHSIFHIPNHKTKFLRATRHSYPFRQ